MEQAILDFISEFYNNVGWAGVVLFMAIESACIPLPSEIIMPLAGWMLIEKLALPWYYNLFAGLYGALGCLLGSIVAYGVGVWGGRPLLNRYGKYVLITQHDLNRADRWFNKNGDWTIFVTRLLPVIRTFISLPAGIARMHFWILYLYLYRLLYLVCWVVVRRLLAWRALGKTEKLDASLRSLHHRHCCPADCMVHLAPYQTYAFKSD
jgi:membrane protein DedA with SNARE-associated domain